MSAVKNVIKDNYNMMLLKDYLREAIKDAGFSHAEISKTPTGTRVALHVTRPGIVIGRKGSGIRDLTEKLATDFGLKNPQISVNEIEKPDLSSSVMCNRMASHLERGTAFRRATMWTMKQIMESGAMGVQITISGKLRGDRSAFEKHVAGILPRAGHHVNVCGYLNRSHRTTGCCEGHVLISKFKIALIGHLIAAFAHKTFGRGDCVSGVLGGQDDCSIPYDYLSLAIVGH